MKTRALRLACFQAWTLVLTLSVSLHAQNDNFDLAELSIEELMEISVTSVSKRATPLNESAAAITVITHEDIKKIGANSIPEALRIVPGLSVGRIDAHQWAISSRGFQDQFANKLLVLIDGRSVYTPFFAGVFWDVQDFALEDLDRIEVIRGPGATLWGANAVNGVINIISKSSKETQGGLLSTTFGNIDTFQTTARYGGKVNDDLHYRVYAKHKETSALKYPDGSDAHDDWRVTRSGFRFDWDPTESSTWTFQGDFYIGESGAQLVQPNVVTFPFTNTVTWFDSNITGNNILGRYNRTFSDDSELTAQLYWNREYFDLLEFEQLIDTYDLDITYRFQYGERHEFVTGLGYRLISDHFEDSALSDTEPNDKTVQLFSAFAQDEISLMDDDLRLTLGTKIEHHDYTGVEIQPSARLLWKVTDKQILWGAVSKAVRIPSRVAQHVEFKRLSFPSPSPLPPTTPSLISVVGTSETVSEELIAYEIGYRNEITPSLSLDVAAYFNDYDNLFTTEAGAPRLVTNNNITRNLIPLFRTNDNGGHVFGAEASVKWQATEAMQWSASYSWLEMDLDNTKNIEGGSPRHQFNILNHYDINSTLALDNVLYYVGSVNDPVNRLDVDAYFRLDTGITWQARDDLEISVWGQNLLDDQHQEYNTILTQDNVEIPRSFFIKALWSF